MNPSELEAQAKQSAAQGQQQYQSDINQSNTYGGQYNSALSNEQDIQKQLGAQTAYMQGAGSGQNVYNTQLQNQISQFDPNIQGQLSSANQSLFGLTGALNGASQQFNTPGGVGAYGLSAPALAGYASSVLQPLQTGVSNANTQVGTLNQQLGTLQTGASQATSAQVQSEQNVVTNLNNTYQAAQSQAAQALNQMQFYSQLAQTQGGLNSQMAQNYAAALSSYQQSQLAISQSKQALAQAGYLTSQTTGQNLTNVGLQNQLNSQAAAQQAAAQKAQAAAQAKSNQEYQTMQGLSQPSSKSGGGFSIGNLFKNFASII